VSTEHAGESPGRSTSAAARVNWSILVPGLLVVALLVALLASGFGNDPHAIPDVRTGTTALPWRLVDLDGKSWSLEELRGKPVVLNFWSTWCGPCKFEHPLLQQAAQAYPDVVFLGVIYSDDPGAVRRYVQREGTAYPHLIDPDGRVAIDYGVTGVPETYFLDRSGLIVHKEAGQVNPQLLRAMLDKIRK
jgi:cytochrome c biogenesis protein CcmG/thiol:disulfide interchange protein DsbE